MDINGHITFSFIMINLMLFYRELQYHCNVIDTTSFILKLYSRKSLLICKFRIFSFLQKHLLLFLLFFFFCQKRSSEALESINNSEQQRKFSGRLRRKLTRRHRNTWDRFVKNTVLLIIVFLWNSKTAERLSNTWAIRWIILEIIFKWKLKQNLFYRPQKVYVINKSVCARTTLPASCICLDNLVT